MSVSHEFRCEGHGFRSHPAVVVVTRAKAGQAPERPGCPACGREMPKVFYPPLAAKWRRGR